MRARRQKAEREPTIALINIVFLMLIFFLVAGTLARPLDKDLTLVRTAELDTTAPADALVIHADGRMTWRGASQDSAASFMTQLPAEARARLRVIPDRDLNAADLVRIGRALRGAGAEKIVIVTEKALE
ncbi:MULTISPECIES: ExbD/TolR family protein [Mameliella]|uniref:ExbD/TolR family protein n=1 Tax=Mameliella TaxID=1434019 RepID=UPI000B52E366|nr:MULTISPECIES: biopolymer transporter ExbD [Mameliella]MCR9272579.1 biopolymer transporter ExbD [Paracoccaceae bacterium]OWV60359.1 biopolymer transporter ExbD [Mameliella alba]